MKTLVRLVAVASLLMAGVVVPAQAAKGGNVRILVEGAYPPFNYVGKDGKLAGFDVDIAKALCAEIKANCEFVRAKWANIQNALLEKKGDAIISSLSITPEREKKFLFTQKYYHTPAKFVRRKGADVVITTQGLKGKRLGVQGSTIHQQYAASNFIGTTVVPYPNIAALEKAMIAGQLDAMLADSIAVTTTFLSKKSGADFEFVGPEVNDVRYFGFGVAVAVRKQDRDLRDRFDAAIGAILADGRYQKISKKYFDFNIYGS